jgi:uncharacterized YccA/Bax inhibitor family protein
MRTGNPVLTQETFARFGGYVEADQAMTLQGTVNKTGILLALVIAGAMWTWYLFFQTPDNPAVVAPWMLGGAIGGFIVGLITAFKQDWAPITAPIYALLEGLFLGALSAIGEASYPGIVMQAVGLTFGTCFVLLLAYSSGLIRATEKFKLGVVAATGAIAVVYLVSLVLSLFGVRVPMIYDNGLVGIGFSLVVVGIAALNLVLDFDFIETGVRNALPRYMEWYGAFGLMVTLIWLYIEILRLLIKLRSRD